MRSEWAREVWSDDGRAVRRVTERRALSRPRLDGAALCFLAWTAAATIAPIGQPAPSAAGGDQIDFDIPAQPLAGALEAFSAVGRFQILMAEPVSAGARSRTVKGYFSPREALVRLIAGEGLGVRFTAERAAVLVRVAPLPADHPLPTAPAEPRARYDGKLQRDLMRVLCQDAATRLGRYRAALDVWLAASGRVERAELFGSTGDEALDRRIVAAFDDLVLAPPPSDLPQPTTLLFLPTVGGAQAPCRDHPPER